MAQRKQIEQFVLEHHRVHYHLDWHPIDVWLRDQVSPSILGYQLDMLMGVLFFTPPHQNIAWLRMAALHNDAQSIHFAELIQAAVETGHAVGLNELLSLESAHWLGDLLLANRFRMIDKIIHFKRYDTAQPLAMPRHDLMLNIRPLRLDEIDVALQVDHAAFHPYWQMQYEDLAVMTSVADIFVGVDIDSDIVAYLLATTYHDAVHLTRLATHPRVQGQGIATMLVQWLIAQNPRTSITVNTQQTNLRSQRLYEKLGFRLLTFKTPVWHRKLFE